MSSASSMLSGSKATTATVYISKTGQTSSASGGISTSRSTKNYQKPSVISGGSSLSSVKQTIQERSPAINNLLSDEELEQVRNSALYRLRKISYFTNDVAATPTLPPVSEKDYTDSSSALSIPEVQRSNRSHFPTSKPSSPLLEKGIFSTMESYCVLENHLLDVKWSQYAASFCGLLLKGSKDIQELARNANGMSNEEADVILKELQDITDSTADSFVNPIAEKLMGKFYFDDSNEGRAKKAKAKEVLASLLKIDYHERAKHADAKNYLQHMLHSMESLLNTEDMRLTLMGNEYNPLERYVYSLTEDCNFRTEKLLGTIFELGKNHMKFTEEEQKKIGCLMIDVIDPILLFIEYCYLSYPFAIKIRTVLRTISALQFLLDDYCKFPAGSATLHQEFEQINMREAVKLLNSIICMNRSLYHEDDSDEDDSDEDDSDEDDSDEDDTDEDYSDEDNFVESDLPDSHMEW